MLGKKVDTLAGSHLCMSLLAVAGCSTSGPHDGLGRGPASEAEDNPQSHLVGELPSAPPRRGVGESPVPRQFAANVAGTIDSAPADPSAEASRVETYDANSASSVNAGVLEDERAPVFDTELAELEKQFAQASDDSASEAQETTGAAIDLGKASQEFNNPITSATLFIVENDTLFLDGDIADETRTTNVTVIEPIIPVPLADTGWTLVNRPILPIGLGADIPVAGLSGTGAAAEPVVEFDNKDGLGDFTFFSLLSPPNDGNGLLWGVGPTFRFPTATDDALGSEKWSVGPAAVALYSSPEFTLGLLNQNFFSYAGNDDRKRVRQSTFQYFAFYNITPQWGIGTAPIVSVNWDAEDGDKLLFPVGLGVTHTFRVAEVPIRLLVEGQHYAVQRDTFGPEWNVRLALGIFLPPLFGPKGVF